VLTDANGRAPDEHMMTALRSSCRKVCYRITRIVKQKLTILFDKPNLDERAASVFGANPDPAQVWWFIRLAHEFLSQKNSRSWAVSEENFNKKTMMPPSFEYFSEVLLGVQYNKSPYTFARSLGVSATTKQHLQLRDQLSAVLQQQQK
jgi:hypothetical protein